jgi:hypothetical protein
MNSASDALRFIHNSQYDVDRIGYSARTFYFDPEVGREATLAAINSKRVSRVNSPRSMNLFSAGRQLIEQRHRAKLLRKGFVVQN